MTAPAHRSQYRSTSVWSSPAAVAAVVASAVSAAVTFRPVFGLVVSVFGPERPPSCTMEAAAGCAISQGPQLIGGLFEVLFLFVVTMIVAVVVGASLVLSIVVVPRPKRRRRPWARAIVGSYALAFAATGLVLAVTGAH